MKIKIECFGGKIGFWLRKIFPKLCGDAYLFVSRKSSNRIIKKYINKYSGYYSPVFISIETINRCNGTCSFCPCNINDESRPYKEMSDKIFNKIIDDLVDMDYDGTLMLLANNEIFLDKKIMKRLRYAREKLSKCHMKVITNGKLLSLKIFDELNRDKLIDELVINNYNTTSELNPWVKKIYDNYKDVDLNINVVINIRYSGEVLSNRAMSSPNKGGNKIIKDYCVLPFTDININPDGNLLICCCDAKEKTNLGNVMDNKIIDIFNNEKYNMIRDKMKMGRNSYSFCKYCDFNDIGTRKRLIKDKMKEMK